MGKKSKKTTGEGKDQAKGKAGEPSNPQATGTTGKTRAQTRQGKAGKEQKEGEVERPPVPQEKVGEAGKGKKGKTPTETEEKTKPLDTTADIIEGTKFAKPLLPRRTMKSKYKKNSS